ncbi:hypothetical protein [Mucilaginibacter sp. dw_454]|uniref:hypothetical protein n=1 Tax=Mucilaginibacter sp. dw_454 TaxID=2720079 RepID=UPI001BD32303|nr:hypothetical protein [Mucilaginibacter sp. dw_454]
MTQTPTSKKTEQYLKERAAKKHSGNKALFIFLVLIAIVIAVVAKIFLTGTLKPEFMKGMPGSDDAYAMAKLFIQPTLKSSSVKFNDDKYQFGKQSDSVYVIQSSVESSTDGGEKVNTEFKIILKYNGGQVDKQKNWSLIDISQH